MSATTQLCQKVTRLSVVAGSEEPATLEETEGDIAVVSQDLTRQIYDSGEPSQLPKLLGRIKNLVQSKLQSTASMFPKPRLKPLEKVSTAPGHDTPSGGRQHSACR